MAAQWPRDHALYHPDAAGTSDPLLFAETIRQTMVYLGHRFQGVPLSHRFIGFDMDFEITDHCRLRVGAVPTDVVLDARWLWLANRPPTRYGFRVAADLLVDGHRCGHGSVRVVAVDEKRYVMLRGRGSPGAEAEVVVDRGERVPAAAVGRLRAKDSVVARGATDGEWWLRLDLNHAILFDHPSDHVPLMGLLEGFRQLGHLLVHEGVHGGGGRETAHDVPDANPATLVSFKTDCLTFGELDLPIGLVVREDAAVPGPRPLRRLTIDAVQNGTVVATSTSEWLVPPAWCLVPRLYETRPHETTTPLNRSISSSKEYLHG